MSTPRFVTLYSGSDGNCTFLSSTSTAILIDAGKSARTLCSKLCEIGSGIEQIRAIFITHEHSDHVSALETLSKKYHIPIHIAEESAKRFDRYPDSAVHSCLVRHDTVFCEQIGDITVRSFRTPHDSKMSVGYRVEFPDGQSTRVLGVATDIGYVSESVCEGLCGCEAVVLEANHDEQMLMDGPYPYDLKQRIRSRRGHLSNIDCAAFAARLARTGTRGFILAHLSRENNQPELAFDEIHSAVSDSDVDIRVASPDEPTELCLSGTEV